MLQKAGFRVAATGFARETHLSRRPPCSITILAQIRNKKYLHRSLKFLISLVPARTLIKRHDLIYASGLDVAILCYISGLGLGKPIVLETGDIRDIQTSSSLLGRLVRWAEKTFLKSCPLLVVTSDDFKEQYYRGWLQSSVASFTIENKLEPQDQHSRADKDQAVQRLSKVRLGYFGVLRSAETLQLLLAATEMSNGAVELVVAGHFANHAVSSAMTANQSGVHYLGPYKSPGDLRGLYDKVDIVWAAYPNIADDLWNWRWARTNRFYEACFYQTAMVSIEGCRDALEIKKHGLGIVLKLNSWDKMASQLVAELLDLDLVCYQQNLSKIESHVYQYTTEELELGRRLRSIL